MCSPTLSRHSLSFPKVRAVLPVLALCAIGASTLSGCEAEPAIKFRGMRIQGVQDLFTLNGKWAARGCRTEELFSLLQVDGKTGLSEEEVYSSGITLCQDPGGLDRTCLKPVSNIHTEIDMVCPFLFNVWDLPKDRIYGPGEAIQSRKRLVAKCSYKKAAEPKWCFTDWCHDRPVNCFTSSKAAEDARPWEGGETPQKQPTGTGVPAREDEEVPSEINIASNKGGYPATTGEDEHSAPASLLQTQDASTPHQHKYRGARRSTLQVTKGAMMVARP